MILNQRHNIATAVKVKLRSSNSFQFSAVLLLRIINVMSIDTGGAKSTKFQKDVKYSKRPRL